MWLASAGGDLIGLTSNDDAERIIAAVDRFAMTGFGLLSIISRTADGLVGRLYVADAPYFVVVRMTDDVVSVDAVFGR